MNWILTNFLKNTAVKVLESHPLGYLIGVKLISRLNILLPHEADYWGFKKLSKDLNNKLFLDLGANIGHSARGFNKIVPDWNILSIEANPAHKHYLEKVKKNISSFDFKIAAVDSKPNTKTKFFVPYYKKMPLHSSASTTLEEARKGILSSFPKHEKFVNYSEIEICTLSIDDLQLEPGIIKIDIQGKEIDALEGGKKTINKYSPDMLVEVLFNPHEITNYLAQHGYKPYTYNVSLNNFSKVEELKLEKGTRNLFFSRRLLENI